MAEKPTVVYGAMAANAGIAVAKFIAAGITGSSALVAEAIHSIVDTGNEGLLLVGLKRGSRPADRAHPFGHGKELYFWGLIVAVLLFGIGGGMSFYEGLHRLGSSEEGQSPLWGFVVLGLALAFEGTSWVIALRSLEKDRHGRPFLKHVNASKDPSKFVPFAEDTAAIAGIFVAAAGLALHAWTGSALPDAIASMVIGVLLASTAVYLAAQSRALLVGESADAETVSGIMEVAATKPYIADVERPLTMHFGPHEILVNVDVRFRPGMSSSEIAGAIDDFESAVRDRCPDVKRVYVEAQALGTRGDGGQRGR